MSHVDCIFIKRQAFWGRWTSIFPFSQKSWKTFTLSHLPGKVQEKQSILTILLIFNFRHPDSMHNTGQKWDGKRQMLINLHYRNRSGTTFNLCLLLLGFHKNDRNILHSLPALINHQTSLFPPWAVVQIDRGTPGWGTPGGRGSRRGRESPTEWG